MKGLAIVLTVFVAGCSNVPKSQLQDYSSPESFKPIHELVAQTLVNPPQPAAVVEDTGPYLSSVQDHSVRIETFVKAHPTWVEREKIVYLFDAIKQSPYTFIREGTQFNGEHASKFLRWKMGRGRFVRNPIRTARDFVDRLCSRSQNSSRPYEVIFSDGSRHLLQDILKHELTSLELALTQSAVDSTLEKSSGYKKPSQTEIAIAPLLTSGPAPTT